MADRNRFLLPLLALAISFRAVQAENDIQLPTDWHVQLLDQGLETPVSESANPSIIVRRICLHLAGRIPTQQELEKHLPTWDWSALINDLIESDEFKQSREPFWREFLCVETEAEEQWLRKELEQNSPVNLRVQSWLTSGMSMPVNQDELLSRFGRLSQSLFTEDWDCARCHSHPFKDISREQFFERAAFFNPDGRLVVPDDWATISHKSGDLIRARIEDGPSVSAIRDRSDDTTPRNQFADWYLHTITPPFSVKLAGRLFQDIAGEYKWWFDTRNERKWTLLGNTLSNVEFNEKEFVRILMLAKFITSPSVPQDADPALPTTGPKVIPISREQWLRSIFIALENDDRIEESMPGPDDGLLTKILFLNRQLAKSEFIKSPGSEPYPAILFQRILSRSPTREENKQWADCQPAEIALALFLSDEFLTIP